MKTKIKTNTTRVILSALFLGALTLPLRAQITVGGDGANTTDSTSYSGADSLTKIGSNTVTLTGGSTYTGGTTINAGALALGGANRLPDVGMLTINSGGVLNMGSFGDYLGSLTMNGNATVAGISGAGGGQFILATGDANDSGTKTLTATGANNAINVNIGISSQFGGVGGNSNLRFDVVGASDNLTVSGVIANQSFDGGGNATSGAIAKSGQGTLILLGNNTYTGRAVISAGTVQVGNGGTTGNITGDNVEIVNNGTLIINRADAFGLGNAISGSGALVQAGAGTTTVSGASSFTGGTTINAGSLLLGAANRLADSGAVTVNGGNFNLGGFSDTVGAVTLTGGAISNGTLTGTAYNLQSGAVSAVLAGNAALTKTSAGTVTLAASNTYTGATAINAGELKVNGSIASSAVTVNSGASLSGSGVVGAISGAGAINPGNSPGILTAPSVDPSGGLSFNFEFTSLNPTFSSATASLNDVLRLTDATTPFIASLASLNTVNIYFNVATFEEGQFFTGAFFTDAQSDFLNEIVGATFNYYVADAAGTIQYNGVNYAALAGGLSLKVSTVNANGADFVGGSVNGQITQFEVVPEPSTYALLVLTAAGFGAHVWRKRRRA